MNEYNEPIERLTINGNEIVLLGTAHVSQKSADMVTEVIDNEEFTTIAIELCDSRYQSMKNPEAFAKMDLFNVIKSGKAPMVMASLALGAFQQRLAEQFDIEPGAEMRAAISSAENKNIDIAIIDRDIGTTLKRVYRSVPWWKRLGIFSGLIASIFSREEIKEDDIEKLKQGDMLESTFETFAQNEKEIYRTLIDERDRYMAIKLYEQVRDQSGQKILAVIGAGHLSGMTKYLADYQKDNRSSEQSNTELSELTNLQQRFNILKVLPWLIVAVVFFGFYLGFRESTSQGLELIGIWILINGGLSALGALIALAHPLTIISAFIAAPLTSLNPTIGAGFVTSLVETYLRKPTVNDFSQLRHDTTEWRGWWRNRVSRVLLVFFLSTLGSAAGTYIAGFKIFSQLNG